jgi:hypothetical protein
MTVVKSKTKGFEQHGFELDDEQGTQAIGTCPFCRRSRKFYVNLDVLLWDCKVCQRNGNFQQFLQARNEIYRAQFKGPAAYALSKDRGIKTKTLKAWGVGWADGFYTIPVKGNRRREITDLKRFTLKGKSLSTSGAKSSLLVPTRDRHESFETIWLCEGEWDAMALWEILDELEETGEVWAVPGAGNLPKNCVELFLDKDVIIAFDNDEPGQLGAVRASSKLDGITKRVRFIRWPNGLPEGFDVRDLCLNTKDASDTLKFLRRGIADQPMMVELAKLKPDDDENTDALDYERLGDRLPLHKASTVRNGFKKWLSIANADCIDVMFGTVFANRLPGDPLWLLFVAPPGGMKTELLLSLSAARDIMTTTTLTPQSLISGCNMGGGDPSLIPKLNHKVLIIKDLTTILETNSIQRDEIFGILRDAYDGKIEKSFGNGVTRRYISQFGLIAGVTPAIETIGRANATLGERFLKYRIRAARDADSGTDAIRQALQNIKQNDLMRRELTQLGHDVIERTITEEDYPSLDEATTDRIIKLAQWVSLLRGVVDRERYTGRINFKPMTEVGTRLAKQLCKLAYGIAMFRGEQVVGYGTYRIITSVAQDTAPDRVEEVVRQMYLSAPDDYQSTREIALLTRFPESTVRFLLQDMVLLKIIEKEAGRVGGWKITDNMLKLMRDLNLYRAKPKRRQ